jgi:hypothetical protein
MTLAMRVAPEPNGYPAFHGSPWEHEGIAPRTFHEYQLYGLTVHSEIPLSFSQHPSGRRPDVTLFFASAEWFAPFVTDLPLGPSSDEWYQHAPLADGSHYLRWPDLFEFLVSPDGRSVACRKLERATLESFQTYLLGHVLSFALVKQGEEPLHATAVVVGAKAVAFLGDCGYGKSTLAAAFVHAGDHVLTDDLLQIREIGGTCHGLPGPQRLKLFPEIAHRFLPRQAADTPMNPDTPKLIVPLEPHQVCARPMPLHALYVLEGVESGAGGVSLTSLAGTQPLMELIRATFNRRLVNPDRLRQQFLYAQRLVSRIPIKRLTYPRGLDVLPQVREAILADVRAASVVKS